MSEQRGYNPSSEEESIREEERKQREGWNERYSDEESYRGQEPLPGVSYFFENYSNEFPNQKVLDLGCGNGRNLRYIAKEGLDAYGMDISDTALKQLKNDFENEGLETHLAQGSFYAIPFQQDSFGSLICINVLQHNDWAGAERSFAEMSRVMHEGGYALVTVRSVQHDIPERSTILDDTGVTFIPSEGSKEGIKIHHYSQEEIERLAKENNFAVLEMKERVGEKQTDGNNVRQGHWLIILKKESGI